MREIQPSTAAKALVQTAFPSLGYIFVFPDE